MSIYSSTMPDMFAAMLHEKGNIARSIMKLIEAYWDVIETAWDFAQLDIAQSKPVHDMLNDDVGFIYDQWVLEFVVQGKLCNWDFRNQEWREMAFAMTGSTSNSKYSVFLSVEIH
eukprot:1585430-Karenia_brevis.AAC.1